MRTSWKLLSAGAVCAGVLWLGDAGAGAAEKKPVLSERGEKLLEQACGLEIGDCIALHRETGNSLVTRLTAVDEGIVKEWVEFANIEGRGVTRLANRGVVNYESAVRGGGCYFSFVTGSHSYNEKPQIELQQMRFGSGFYGGQSGAVLPIAKADLTKLELKDLPSELTTEYKTLRECQDAMEKAKHSLLARLGEYSEIAVGGCFAVRCNEYTPKGDDFKYDTLAALRVVARDEYSATFVWRVMKKFR